MPNYTLPINELEHATLMAALRFYQGNGLADNPKKRPELIHNIATCDGTLMAALSGGGVDKLCERMNFLTRQARPRVTKTLQRRLEEATKLVEDFNRDYPVGTEVVYYELIDPKARPHPSKTRSTAWVMGGHSAMIMVDGVSGGVALEHIEVKNPKQIQRIEAD